MLWQLAINGLIAGSIISLLAVSFGIIFSISRFFHFAHGIVFTAGAYFTFLFSVWMQIPLVISVLLAIGATAVLGSVMEIAVYKPLKRKGSSALVLLLASLGLYIVLQNIISLVFSDDIKTIRSGEVSEGIYFLGARITSIQILIISVSIATLIVLLILIKKTNFGRILRAIANDSELARLSGVESDRFVLVTFAFCSALAGLAGILVALDVDMTPTMGLNALMLAVVAVIIGGAGSIPGIALGALLLGFTQHLGVWFISSQWQDAIAFVILLVFLIFRPQGFLGRKVKKASV